MYREIDGRDYAMYINHDTKTIVIKATYYTAKNDAISSISAQNETQFWNDESGKHQYIVSEGGKKIAYDIVFDLNTIEADKPVQQVGYDRLSPFEAEMIGKKQLTPDLSSNSYSVKPDGEFKEPNVGGVTTDGTKINLKASHTNDASGSHEIGHTLGIRHRQEGLMTESLTDKFHRKTISSEDIQLIIHNAIKKDPESGGKGTLYPSGKPHVSPDRFRKGEVNDKP